MAVLPSFTDYVRFSVLRLVGFRGLLVLFTLTALALITTTPILSVVYNNSQLKYYSLITAECLRRDAIVSATADSFDYYFNNAWGYDEVREEGGVVRGVKTDNLGITMVRSMDTLYLMGLDSRFNRARTWVMLFLRPEKQSMDWHPSRKVMDMYSKQHVQLNKHRTTLQQLYTSIIGPLHSLDALVGGDPTYLKASRLFEAQADKCFLSPQILPNTELRLQQKSSVRTCSSLCQDCKKKNCLNKCWMELATIPPILRYLSVTTGTSSKAANKPLQQLKNRKLAEIEKMVYSAASTGSYPGLLPQQYSVSNGSVMNPDVTLNNKGWLYLEHVLFQWIRTKKERYSSAYKEAIQAIDHYLKRKISNWLFITALEGQQDENVMDMDLCGFPGLLALGVQHSMPSWHLTLAIELTETCIRLHKIYQYGMPPGRVFIPKDGRVVPMTAAYHHEQGLAYSLYNLKSTTNNPQWQDKGWDLFRAMHRHCRNVSGVILSVDDVTRGHKGNKLPTHFISATMKFLFLLFDSEKTDMIRKEYLVSYEGHFLT